MFRADEGYLIRFHLCNLVAHCKIFAHQWGDYKMPGKALSPYHWRYLAALLRSFFLQTSLKAHSFLKTSQEFFL